MSLQSTGDTANSISLIVLFTLDKVWLYAAPPAFCLTFYPVHLISFVYGFITIPGIGFNWLITVFFDQILNGDKIEDADFGPVSYGLAALCFATLASGFYTLWFGLTQQVALPNLLFGLKKEGKKSHAVSSSTIHTTIPGSPLDVRRRSIGPESRQI